MMPKILLEYLSISEVLITLGQAGLINLISALSKKWFSYRVRT